jgi:hypothetical protein
VPDKQLSPTKRICFDKKHDKRLEEDICMGKVTLKSPWPKIRNLCGTLHIPVPSLEPPGPSELGEEVEEPE